MHIFTMEDRTRGESQFEPGLRRGKEHGPKRSQVLVLGGGGGGMGVEERMMCLGHRAGVDETLYSNSGIPCTAGPSVVGSGPSTQ